LTCSLDVRTTTTDVLASSKLFASKRRLSTTSRQLWLSSATDIRTSSELDRTACWLHTTSTIDVRITTTDVLASSELWLSSATVIRTSSELDGTARWLHSTSTIDVWITTIDVLASSELFAESHGRFRARRQLSLSSSTDIRASSELDTTAFWLHTTSTLDLRRTTIDVLASSELFASRHQRFEASRTLRLPPPRISRPER
jgi:hypothetical protein